MGDPKREKARDQTTRQRTRAGQGPEPGAGHRRRDDDFAREGEAVSQEFADSQGGDIDSDTERHEDPHGATLPVRGGQRMPSMPHERDQSSGSQSESEDPVTQTGAQAHEDLAKGRVDTDRGPPMDELYGKELRPSGRSDKRDGTR